MKKILGVVLAVLALSIFTACGSSKAMEQKATSAENNTQTTKVAVPATNGKKILVAYYSRTGDNYAVGKITKGNTHIVADMIAQMLGADEFEIKTVKDYPADYRECTVVAKQELETNARPELSGKVANMKDYDVVFVGYPIWWTELPMPVYTFLESYDFNGKTIVPFCTSAGNVLTGKEDGFTKHAKGAKLLQGLGIEGKRAQQDPDSVRPQVKEWLTKLGFVKSGV